jgi:hypothetical protein
MTTPTPAPSLPDPWTYISTPQTITGEGTAYAPCLPSCLAATFVLKTLDLFSGVEEATMALHHRSQKTSEHVVTSDS